MPTFAVEIRIYGSVYIKGPNIEKAKRHLGRVDKV
ncbi:hypothetical protein Rleg4DRAFT_2291 [Rhizobium leguminosarum bv. trifolii WSM2297]|uniref:Uncharacterized protein n=1 Tax=Rhizobium leguminosarum bv. trifolii WSM2297 TaxID=754762 RepID=J0W4J5_RHILT|nr:hypothetical protein Rleg4DRAFT_2291 [Rhizobium leguminosarum bv. trifolii WSM2297]